MRPVFFVLSAAAVVALGFGGAYLERHGWSPLGYGLIGAGAGCVIGNWSQTRFSNRQ
jgi:hypothetical protein